MTTCEAANSIAERDWPANLRHSPTLLVWANVDQLPIKERPFRLGRSARWPLGGVLARGEEPAATRDHLSRFRPSRPTPGINGFVAVMPHQSLLGMFHRRLDGRDDPRFDCVIRCQSEPNADLARAASLSVWEPTRRRYARSACLQHHAAVRGSRPSAAAVPSTPLWPLSCSGCPDLKVYAISSCAPWNVSLMARASGSRRGRNSIAPAHPKSGNSPLYQPSRTTCIVGRYSR